MNHQTHQKPTVILTSFQLNCNQNCS